MRMTQAQNIALHLWRCATFLTSHASYSSYKVCTGQYIRKDAPFSLPPHSGSADFFLKEWHCTLRGPTETDFEGGLYHFRILLPADYPFRPPSLMMLTPNGRFETGTKVCVFLPSTVIAVSHFGMAQICISFTNCTLYSRTEILLVLMYIVHW